MVWCPGRAGKTTETRQTAVPHAETKFCRDLSLYYKSRFATATFERQGNDEKVKEAKSGQFMEAPHGTPSQHRPNKLAAALSHPSRDVDVSVRLLLGQLHEVPRLELN